MKLLAYTTFLFMFISIYVCVYIYILFELLECIISCIFWILDVDRVELRDACSTSSDNKEDHESNQTLVSLVYC